MWRPCPWRTLKATSTRGWVWRRHQRRNKRRNREKTRSGFQASGTRILEALGTLKRRDGVGATPKDQCRPYHSWRASDAISDLDSMESWLGVGRFSELFRSSIERRRGRDGLAPHQRVSVAQWQLECARCRFYPGGYLRARLDHTWWHDGTLTLHNIVNAIEEYNDI